LALTREQKKQAVASYVDQISRSQAMILTNYRGLCVADMTELRRRLRETDAVLQVVKNTLFRLALEQAEIPFPAEKLEGPIAVGYCFQDPPPVAKVLVDFAKETQSLQIRGAMLGAKLLDAEEIKALADLPSREVLLAQLIASVEGPMSSLVSTINAPMRELVQVLQARSEQEEQAAA
jgi:large subunit ribosomal protein L10